MDGSVSYSEPGSAPRPTSADAAQASYAPAPLARLSARIINAAIWLGAGLLLLFGSAGVIGGIALVEIWPALNDLLVGDLPDIGRITGDALVEGFAHYRVRDAILIGLIPFAAAASWIMLRVLYLCLLVRFAGGDLGHLAVGMRVVNYRNGGRPSFGQALGRAILKQLDILVLPWMLNGIMVVVNRDRRHSYDYIANTVVVAEGWTALPFLEPRPARFVIRDPQLNENAAIPLPPSHN